MDIYNKAVEQKSYMTKVRRSLHQIPELGMEEYETSAYIKNELRKSGIEYIETANTGIIVTLGPVISKKTLALRADMDGLRIIEKNNVDYISKNENNMHACGHDGHMASLLGAVMILHENENKLKNRVKIIFQPSEEDCRGAQAIIDERHLDDVDEIFGLHIFTDIDSSNISVESGYRMANSLNFSVEFKGKSGHAGKPQLCKDTVVCASAFVMNLQSIVSRKLDPIRSGVVTIGKIRGGSAHNIVAGETLLEGTARFFTDDVGKMIKNEIINIANSTGIIYGCEPAINFRTASHPSVINDEELTKDFVDFINKNVTELSYKMTKVPPMMLGEDFSNYQKFVKGVFAFVGGRNEKIGCIYQNHHEKFNFDEEALINAAALYVAFAMR